ncbi:MAG: PQQ-binding-like beta-propeller repeat protein [Planctomycetota bacterium]
MASSIRVIAVGLFLAAFLSGDAGAADGGNAGSGQAFRFLAIADPHFFELEKAPKSLGAFKQFLADVKPLNADFLVVLGDVCGERRPALAQARKIAEESGLKVYFVSGNHDDTDGQKPEDFLGAFGEGSLFYSFNHKGYHFVMHWSQRPQFPWLEKDIASAPSGAPVIFCQHYPPDNRYRKIFDKHPVAVSLTGHVHGYRTGMTGNLRDVNLPPFPEGFAVADVMGDGKIKIAWRPHGISKRLVIVHPAEGAEVFPGSAPIVVTAFDSGRDVVKVEYNDGAGWKPMVRSTNWSWTGSCEFRSGAVEARAVDSAGETWTAQSAYRPANAAAAVKIGADWLVRGGTPDNRRSTPDAVTPPLRFAWRAAVGGRCHQPVLAGGKLYVTSSMQDYEENNILVCLDAANGKELWRAPLGGSPMTPAAVTAGVVGVFDEFGRACGFDAATGKRLWLVEGVPGAYYSYDGKSGITAADGVFYAGNFWALEARTGSPVWKAQIVYNPVSFVAAVSGGRILGAGNAWQNCLDVKTGAQIWRVSGSASASSMFCGDQAMVSTGKSVLVNAADGKEESVLRMGWRTADGAVSADGNVAVFVEKGRLAAVSLSEKKEIWKSREPLKEISAATAAGAFVWVSASDGLHAYALADGSEAWNFRIGAPLAAPIASGNAVFVAGEDGCVYALAGG